MERYRSHVLQSNGLPVLPLRAVDIVRTGKKQRRERMNVVGTSRLTKHDDREKSDTKKTKRSKQYYIFLAAPEASDGDDDGVDSRKQTTSPTTK